MRERGRKGRGVTSLVSSEWAMSTIRPIKGLGNDAHKVGRQHAKRPRQSIRDKGQRVDVSVVGCRCRLSLSLFACEVKGSKVLTRNYLSTCGIGLSGKSDNNKENKNHKLGPGQGKGQVSKVRVVNIILSDFMMNLCPKIPTHLHAHTLIYTHITYINNHTTTSSS